MKLPLTFLLTLAVAAPVVAQPRFYAEAGVSYLAVEGTTSPDVHISLPLLARDHDKTAWSPFIAAGWNLSDHFGLRTAYRYVDGLNVQEAFAIQDGTGTYHLTTRYSDDLHVVTLAPEFRWRAGHAAVITLSPELNWVHLRESVHTWTNAPAVDPAPPRTRSDEDFSLGGSAAVVWALTARWSLPLRYSYLDLDPSWNRRAHAVSAGLAWQF